MRNMIIISVLTMLSFASCSTTKMVNTLDKELKWLEGEWIGVGFQTDAMNNPTWKIELKVDLEKKTCKIEYPSLECSGEWKLIKGNQHSATFAEKITKGKDKCYNGGKLIVTMVNENHASYSFFYPENDKLGAFSTLVKKEWHILQNSTRL